MKVTVDRPYIQLLTAQLRELAEEKAREFDVLHDVFVELLFRERRAARELRKAVGDRLSVFEKEYFPWPTTEAPGRSGQLDDSYFQYQQGLLGFVGYRVGASGVGAAQRQDLLDSVYLGPLPLLNSKEYMAEWGQPSTGTRLKKMAESIAAFARNAKRRDGLRMSTAIVEWGADLNYLKATYYVGRYQFPWPEAAA